MNASDDYYLGIQGIYYQKNEEEMQFLEGNCVSLIFRSDLKGRFQHMRVDGAGNKGESNTSPKNYL